MPYGEDVHVTCPRTLYYGWLQYRDICEPYMPARVLQQVGMVQTIPPTILHPTKVTRSQGKHNYKLDFPSISASDGWKTFPIGGCLNILSYTPVTLDDSGATHTGYMDWYQKYSHPFVLPPERRNIEMTNATTCLVPIYWVNKFRNAANEAIAIAMEADPVRAETVKETVEDLMANFHTFRR
ncbi:IMP dehydrogenase/GMP reductase [Striga asiatica]|uniref:IMP dehydrogenase/GMP reductase n=1 Tax=Striga asiatica TaxID=4170 RepID=A0A5A7P7H5_STRAF|nr:IMP dehydrogenase/GMP reductase [Striga asiatica]